MKVVGEMDLKRTRDRRTVITVGWLATLLLDLLIRALQKKTYGCIG